MTSAVRNTHGSIVLRNSFLINFRLRGRQRYSGGRAEPAQLFARGIVGDTQPVRATIAVNIFPGSAGQACAQRLNNMASAILLEDAQNQMRLLRKIIRVSWPEQCRSAAGLFEQPALQAADMQAC